jgi:hypothetical protein
MVGFAPLPLTRLGQFLLVNIPVLNFPAATEDIEAGILLRRNMRGESLRQIYDISHCQNIG